MSSEIAPAAAVRERAVERVSVELAEHGFAVASAAQLWEIAGFVARANLKPAGIQTQADAFMVMAYGQMYGYREMEALQRLHVVKGKVCLGAADMAAHIHGHPLCRMYRLWLEGAGEERAGCVQSERAGRGGPNAVVRFTLGDARRAGLYDEKWRDRNGEPSVWCKYTDDQLLWKAVARDYRRNWPDAVRGAHVYEDLRELEHERAAVPARSAPPPASRVLEQLAARREPAEIELPAARELEVLPAEPAKPDETGPNPAEPDPAGPAPEPPRLFEGPLMPGLRDAIRKRAEQFLPQHRAQAHEQLEVLVRERLGAGAPVVGALEAVRDWRLRMPPTKGA